MNICMFTNTYLPHVGGVANSVAMFSEDLFKMGHKVLVVAPSFPQETHERRSEEILRVPAIQNFNGSDFSARIAIPFLISTRIKEFMPDVIHSHHPYLLGDAALRTSRRYDVPLIFTHHTLYEEYTHYISMGSDQMKQFVVNLSTEYANLCDHVIAPSASIENVIKKRGVHVPINDIPTGVDIDLYQKGNGDSFKKQNSLPEDTLIIGHVGRLAQEKNISFMAHSVADYLKSHKGHFLVVGSGECEKDIREIFRQKGVEDQLTMAGVKKGLDLVNAYAAMDLFVFASKSETQGMVLAEAMAAKTPVVALDASGVREVVSDRENGLLISAGATENDFTAAIERAAKDLTFLKKAGENAVSTALGFSRKKTAEKLICCYETAIKDYAGRNSFAEKDMGWDKLLNAISAEWDLIFEKTAAVVKSFSDESDPPL